MRSTRDIINAVKDGQAVTEDELRTGLLVMSAVDAFTWRELYDLIEVIEQDKPGQAAVKAAFARNILERMFQAKRDDPAQWLGPEHTPGSAEHDRWLTIAATLLEKIGDGIGEPIIPESAAPKDSRQPNAMPGTPPAAALEATEKAEHSKGRGRKRP